MKRTEIGDVLDGADDFVADVDAAEERLGVSSDAFLLDESRGG
jgi:hypothetical protein